MHKSQVQTCAKWDRCEPEQQLTGCRFTPHLSTVHQYQKGNPKDNIEM